MTRDLLKVTSVRSDWRENAVPRQLPWLIGGITLLLVCAVAGTGLLSQPPAEAVPDDQELAELESATTGALIDQSVTSAVALRSTMPTPSGQMIWLTGSIEVDEDSVTSHDAQRGDVASRADHVHQVAAK